MENTIKQFGDNGLHLVENQKTSNYELYNAIQHLIYLDFSTAEILVSLNLTQQTYDDLLNEFDDLDED